MYCSMCGKEVNPNDRFCKWCGTSLNNIPNMMSNGNIGFNYKLEAKNVDRKSNIIEKVIYISLLFLSSIGMIILMYRTWIYGAVENYPDYKNNFSLAQLFNSIAEQPSSFFKTLIEKGKVNSILLLILVIVFVCSLILTIVFLIRMAISIEIIKGLKVGLVAMIFSILLFILVVVYKNSVNISILERNINTSYSYYIAVAPYIFLFLSILNIVIIILLATIKKRKDKRSRYQGYNNSIAS